MKRTDISLLHSFFLVTTVLLATMSATATGMDSGFHWIEIDPDQNPKLAQTIEGQCLPAGSHFSFPIPAPADVLFVFWDGERPVCTGAIRTSDSKPDSVLFLSPEDPSDVIRGFRNTLDGLEFTEHSLPREADTTPCCLGTQYGNSYTGKKREKTIFIQAPIDTFCWNEHLYRAPTVIIKEAYGIYAKAGYKSVIEIFRPDLSMPSDSMTEPSASSDEICD